MSTNPAYGVVPVNSATTGAGSSGEAELQNVEQSNCQMGYLYDNDKDFNTEVITAYAPIY